MPQCKHYDICGRDVEGNPADGLCILHSTDATKDAHAFAEALATHRERNGDNFVSFVFPGRADFGSTRFTNGANFEGVTFNDIAIFGDVFGGIANFTGTKFTKEAGFGRTTFSEWAIFIGTNFSGGANFIGTKFTKNANIDMATFSSWVSFEGATFGGIVSFNGTKFTKEAGFGRTTFSEWAFFLRATFNDIAYFDGTTFLKGVDFTTVTFLGRTLFTGRQGSAIAARRVFTGIQVHFMEVVINPPDAVTFLGADLTKCRFQDTDLRKVQLVDIKWPQKGWRTAVYDEIAPVEAQDGSVRPWSQIERLYRELKQNYEDRRDYERAGDFHYGEKEMRRQNPDTTLGLRFLLMLYWLFSGYGERYLRPLVWTGLLFLGSIIGYMWWGLRSKDGGSSLTWTNGWDWLQGAYYSFRVMTFLKPDDWVPVSYAQGIYTFQTLLSPLFLGLFALALRQRLKR